jgi:aryl-alcohol dehydrogenase-like predicted oxidoreductase
MDRKLELPADQVAEAERHINSETLTATQLQALVRNMDHSKKKWRHLRQEEFMNKVRDENEQLYYNYPSLWQMHAEDRLDSTFFEMLALKRKIEKGELTDEQASVMVGQRLFQRFAPTAVQPTTSVGPPPMSYSDYYKKYGGE